jgi:hypothetical protein
VPTLLNTPTLPQKGQRSFIMLPQKGQRSFITLPDSVRGSASTPIRGIGERSPPKLSFLGAFRWHKVHKPVDSFLLFQRKCLRCFKCPSHVVIDTTYASWQYAFLDTCNTCKQNATLANFVMKTLATLSK